MAPRTRPPGRSDGVGVRLTAARRGAAATGHGQELRSAQPPGSRHKTGRRAWRRAAVRGVAPRAEGSCGRVDEYWVARETLVSYWPSWVLRKGRAARAGRYRGEESKR